jgi:hypothetical protein
MYIGNVLLVAEPSHIFLVGSREAIRRGFLRMHVYVFRSNKGRVADETHI